MVTARAGGVVLALAAAVLTLSGVAGAASNPPPKAQAHRTYLGQGARKDVVVALKMKSSTTIASSPAGTAPELLHSNVNIHCSNDTQANSGMPKIKLKLKHGLYRFKRHFERHGVQAAGPNATKVNLAIDVSGAVKSASLITGKVKVVGTGGCSVSAEKYSAPLQPQQ